MFFSLGSILSAQTTFTSTGGGDWETGSTWDQGGSTPTGSDHVIIADTHTVTIASGSTMSITDITLQGSGRLDWIGTGRRINASGNLIMSGTSSLTGTLSNHRLEISGTFSIPSGVATIGGIRFRVNGLTTITGELSFNNTVGTKVFRDITVAASGHWNNNSLEDFTIRGDIVTSAGNSWTGCSAVVGCRYVINTDGQGISGTGTVTFSDLRINDNVTYTNSGNLTITDDIDGQTGTGASLINNGTLTLSDNGSYIEITFDFDNNPNTVIYAGAGNENMNLGPYHNLTINKPAGVQSDVDGADITVNNDMIITEGLVRVRTANTLLVTGDLTVSGGELTVLTVAAATVDINGDLIVNGTGEVDQNIGTIDVAGNATVSASGTVTVNNATLFNVDGTYQASGGTNDFNSGIATLGGLTIDASQTVTVAGITTTVGGTTLVNGTLTIDGTTGTKNLNNMTLANDGNLGFTSNETVNVGGNLLMSGTSDVTGSNTLRTLNVTGTFGVSSGTATITGVTLGVSGQTTLDGELAFTSNVGDKTFGNVQVNGSGNWNNGTVDESFSISGNIQNNGTWTGCNGTGCDYTLTAVAGTISGTTAINAMSDIIINTGASYTNTNTGGLFVTDRLTGTGAFINGANGALNYSGNNSAGANFDITSFTASASGNTVTMSRSGDQQLRATTEAGNNYHNLIVNMGAASNDLTLTADITIDNALTLTLGDVLLGTNNLLVAQATTFSSGSASSHINATGTGSLRRSYSSTNSFTAPLGDGTNYAPLVFSLTEGTIGGGAYIDFGYTASAHPSRDVENEASGGDDDGTAATAYIDRYWSTNGNAISSPKFDASYAYDPGGVTGTEGEMVPTLYRSITVGMSTFLDWFVTGTIDYGGDMVNLTGGDGFGDLFAMDNGATRLPIVLLSFDAKLEEDVVRISWTTASEIDNKLFAIERSTNGLDFESILFKDGAGNSTGVIDYTITDFNPLIGRSYYRLKQTDFNGTFDYSEVRSIVNHEGITDTKVFPNPLGQGQMLTINTSASTKALKLKNALGEVLIEKEHLDAQSTIKILWKRDWLPGLYFIYLISDEYVESKKLIVK